MFAEAPSISFLIEGDCEVTELRLDTAMDADKRALRQGQRRSMPKIPRWLVGLPKLPGLPVIELRLRQELPRLPITERRRREDLIEPRQIGAASTVELPRVISSSRVKRPRQVWD